MPTTKKQTTSTATKSDEVKQTPSAATPAVAPTTPTPVPVVSKQTLTLAKLKEAWQARGINVEKLEQRQDGKFLSVRVAEGWPEIRLGPTGGISIPEVRSYANAFIAATTADQLWKKQSDRDAKKTATPETPKKEGAKPEAKKTPTAKKTAAHEKIEQQLQA